jgi:hypothetical protein
VGQDLGKTLLHSKRMGKVFTNYEKIKHKYRSNMSIGQYVDSGLFVFEFRFTFHYVHRLPSIGYVTVP